MSCEESDRKIIIHGICASCLFLFAFLAMAVTGCGRKRYDISTYEFKKNGHIIEHMSEEFPPDSYDESDWEKETGSLIEAYNKKNKDAIRLYDISAEEGILRCSVEYADDDAYYYLNEQPLFYGTVDQALKAGYSLSFDVYDVKGELVKNDVIRGMRDSHIIIMNAYTADGADVLLYKKAKYVTGNAEVDSSLKRLHITDDNTVYIVFD